MDLLKTSYNKLLRTLITDAQKELRTGSWFNSYMQQFFEAKNVKIFRKFILTPYQTRLKYGYLMLKLHESAKIIK